MNAPTTNGWDVSPSPERELREAQLVCEHIEDADERLVFEQTEDADERLVSEPTKDTDEARPEARLTVSPNSNEDNEDNIPGPRPIPTMVSDDINAAPLRRSRRTIPHPIQPENRPLFREEPRE